MTKTTWTFRELDAESDRAKGTAFRAFKQCLSTLVETRDFVVLDSAVDVELIADLRRDGRIYASTHNAVLLYASGARAVRETLVHDF